MLQKGRTRRSKATARLLVELRNTPLVSQLLGDDRPVAKCGAETYMHDQSVPNVTVRAVESDVEKQSIDMRGVVSISTVGGSKAIQKPTVRWTCIFELVVLHLLRYPLT